MIERSSGIILHPTSLPGPDGIGDFGPEAYRWIEFLAKAGCGLWQILPLGPTGYGDSPYQSFSAFAGNPNLISPVMLLEKGLLSKTQLEDRPAFPSDRVDFGSVIQWKRRLLDHAYHKFTRSHNQRLIIKYNEFCTEQAFWLNDFAVFMAIKSVNGQKPWHEWPQALLQKEPDAIKTFKEKYLDLLLKEQFIQFIFFLQWSSLKEFAGRRSIRIIGDVPIFTALDSCDVWSRPELFTLDSHRRPKVVAGVPPDYFSPFGQLWGNPLYRWENHRKDHFAWWSNRIRSNLQNFDIIRLDHFRGFAACWQVPSRERTAENGRWIKGPGRSFFIALQENLGSIALIAEDLGDITPDVIALRDEFNLPGMKVLQFAFDGVPENAFLPHNYPVNCVAYTGTHDNDTSRGWYEHASEQERDFCRRYFARNGEDIAWDMLRAVWASSARMCLAPMQDLLDLSSEARMNYPSKSSGNWQWRMPVDSFNSVVLSRLKDMNQLYGRTNLLERKSISKKSSSLI